MKSVFQLRIIFIAYACLSQAGDGKYAAPDRIADVEKYGLSHLAQELRGVYCSFLSHEPMKQHCVSP